MSEERETITVDREHNGRQSAGALYLHLALQDALCDLVQIKGDGYLDEFVAKRKRRTAASLQTPNEALRDFTGEEASAAFEAISEEQISWGEEILDGVIAAVRRDPTPSI